MFETSAVKVSELAGIFGSTNSVVSKRLKRSETGLVISNGRIVGVSPEGVESYFASQGFHGLEQEFVCLVGTNVGGVGKTTSCVSLAAATRRLTGRDKAVVVIDTDSQGSATTQILGDVIAEGKPVLDDYLTNKATIEQLLTPVGDPSNNFWIVGSNLNNIYLDRRFTSGQKIRTIVKEFLDKILLHFGAGTKVFIDTPPQLSAVTQSATCALAQLRSNSVFLIPLRTDLFSIKGAKICMTEMEELYESYKGVDQVNVQCFLSSYDSRLKVSVDTMRTILEDAQLKHNICSIIVRHSTEVTKAAMKNENIYSSGVRNNITSDYTDLALSLMGWEGAK